MGRRGAQRDASVRTHAWVDMVRTLNLTVANSFDDSPELEHEGTLFFQRRMRWSDWILTNQRFEESKVCLRMHCRSDYRPVIMVTKDIEPVILRFRKPALTRSTWRSTPRSKARVERYWVEHMEGSDNLADIQKKLEDLAKSELEIERKEYEGAGEHQRQRALAEGLTDQELHLLRLDRRAEEPGLLQNERERVNRARWRLRRRIRMVRKRRALRRATDRPPMRARAQKRTTRPLASS